MTYYVHVRLHDIQMRSTFRTWGDVSPPCKLFELCNLALEVYRRPATGK